MKEIVIDAVKC